MERVQDRRASHRREAIINGLLGFNVKEERSREMRNAKR